MRLPSKSDLDDTLMEGNKIVALTSSSWTWALQTTSTILNGWVCGKMYSMTYGKVYGKKYGKAGLATPNYLS